MTFVPHKQPLQFQCGIETDAYKWLHAIYAQTPFSDVKDALEIRQEIPATEQALNQTALPNGPLNIKADCPVTGRPLKLLIFRDMTGAILRASEAEDHAFDVLPAPLALATRINDATLRDMPYHQRNRNLPVIKVQVRPSGIHWGAVNATLSNEEVSEILSASVSHVAGRILAAPPVADPRLHKVAPDGARFAPCSVWPELPSSFAGKQCLETLAKAFAVVRGSKIGSRYMHLIIQRRFPDEPWSTRSQADLTQVYWIAGSGAGPDRVLAKLLRCAVNRLPGIPDSYRYGPPGQDLISLRGLDATSAHEVISHAAVVEAFLEQLPEDVRQEMSRALDAPLS